MVEITHWADVMAEEILRSGKKHLVATGITPSGHIHIGNMREVVTADATYRALLDQGADAEIIYVADTYDPLRKVYPFLDESFAQHVGKPISEIPCPCGECSSYAEHFLKPFYKALDRLGIHPKIYRADEMYKQGMYVESIKTALLNRDKIARILQEHSGKEVTTDWSPFNPICSKCGRLTTTKVTGFDIEAETIDYACSCGDCGTVSMTGGGKLTWRVDWPARWGVLGVTVEPFGKDHASKGGSYDTGKAISEEIYGYKAPYPIVYEWIMLGTKGAMSSSSGVVVAISDMLEVLPPEILRYLIIRTKPEKHIRFDPSLPLLNLVEEYEKLSANAEESGYNKRLKELSHAAGICHTDIPFKHMITIYQVAHGDLDKVMKIVERSGYSTKNEKCILELAENVGKWLDMYAPDMVKFSVKEEIPVQAATLNATQRAFLQALSEEIDAAKELSGEDYHNLVYSSQDKSSTLNARMALIVGISADELEVRTTEMFKAIYLAVLGQQSGPKAGWFLSSMEKDFLAKRFKETASYRP